MDALLDMLRAMRLSGGIFLDAEFTAPWCVSAQVGPEDCTPFTAEPRHIIAYHYVTEGRCLLKVGDQKPVEVESGEIVVVPRNDHHVIASATSLRPVSADYLIQAAPEGGWRRSSMVAAARGHPSCAAFWAATFRKTRSSPCCRAS